MGFLYWAIYVMVNTPGDIAHRAVLWRFLIPVLFVHFF